MSQEPIVHRWESFFIWPTKRVNMQIFFHSASEEWLSFLLESNEILSDIMTGMLVQQSGNRQDNTNNIVAPIVDREMFQSIVSNNEDLILVASRSPLGVPSIV